MDQSRKTRSIMLVGLFMTLLIGGWSVLASSDYEQSVLWSPPEVEESIAGAWLQSTSPEQDAPRWNTPLRIQQTLTPLDATGDRLLVRETEFNLPDPPGGESVVYSDFVGQAVRVGRNTYEYRANAFAKIPQENDRGKIVHYLEVRGRTELIDRDHRYETGFTWMAYGPDADINPADGFPDEDAEPIAVFGPADGQWYKRVRVSPSPQSLVTSGE